MDIEQLLNEERVDIGGLNKIGLLTADLKPWKPDIDGGTLIYKMEIGGSFPNPDSKADPKDVKQQFISKVLMTDKLYKFIKSYIYDSRRFFNPNNKEEKMFDFKIDKDSCKVIYSVFNNFYNFDIKIDLKFDFGEWFVNAINTGKVNKALFFKDYKIKFYWDLNPLVRDKTDRWKEITEKVFKWAIFNKSDLKAYMKKLTGLTMNPDKIDFEITINATKNEIKLILLRGIIRWLKKVFGIPAKYSKFIIAGLTVLGIIKLLKDDDKDVYKTAKNKYDRWMDS